MNFVNYLLQICTTVIIPIQLQYELVATKFIRKKLLIMNNVAMAPNFKDVLVKIKFLEEEILRHSRLHLGLETIFQGTANTVLFFYAYSTTRARQGLSSMFDGDEKKIMGLSLPPQFIMGALLGINFLSFIRVQINGIVEGYASNYSLLGKLTILISIICATSVRIFSMTLYFSTTLGLFSLLGHFQGEKYQT